MMPEDPYAYVVAAFQAPPSPDYMPGPREPEQAPPLPDFISEPVYLKFMPSEDEVFPTEEQPLPAADDDDDDGSSDDDEDDDDDDVVEEDEDEDEDKEEHPASADSISPPPVHRTTARISIPVQAPSPFWFEAEIDRLFAIPSPPPSPLSPSRNREDSHDSGMGARRQAPPGRECTYQGFMKCKPLYLRELALMCARMFPEESDKIERYISGLPDMIYESIMTSKPKTMQEVIEFMTEMMDKKISTF
nr:hypothetical protein [Tanacetum cinerariifolium]